MIFVLYILWFIFSNAVTAETAVSGAVVCSFLYFFLCRFLGYSLKKDIMALKKIPSFIVFLLILFFHIVMSNIGVIRVIRSVKKKPDSEIITFNPGLKKFSSKCIFANSITITPGTFTVGLKNGVYSVHALTPEFSEGLEDSTILKRLKNMEEKDR